MLHEGRQYVQPLAAAATVPGDSIYQVARVSAPPIDFARAPAQGMSMWPVLWGTVILGSVLLLSSRRFRESLWQVAAVVLALLLVAAVFVGGSVTVVKGPQTVQSASHAPMYLEMTNEMNGGASSRSSSDVLAVKPPIMVTNEGAVDAPLPPAATVQPEPDDMPGDEAPATPVTVFVGNAPDGELAPRLPDWVHEQQVATGEDSRPTGPYVVSSGQYASVGEAEQELMVRIKEDVRRRLAAEYHIDALSPTTQQLLDSEVIQRRAHEQLELKIGEFTHPMYRVHWQVALRPETDQVFYEAWQQQTVTERLGQFAALLGGITLLFGGLAVFFYSDRVTKGRRWNKVTAASVVAIVGAGVVVTLLG